MELPEHATPVRNDSKAFTAFVARFGDMAMVYVYRRVGKYDIDFRQPVSAYETLSQGASQSARREISKLEAA